MAVPLLQRFGVTHVAVFASYNYQAGGGGLCTSQAGNPNAFCGFGDDSKWYWMVRIGNGTIIPTALGNANVTYRQVITNAQTGASDYHRIITINGHSDDTRVTSNFAQVQLPTSNTLLGLIMRHSYPTGVANQPIRPTDSSDLGDETPHFIHQVYQSDNKYVIIYSVNYGQNPVLTAQLNPPYVLGGDNTTITGALSYPNGQPVAGSSVKALLQYSTDKTNWITIGNMNVNSTGALSSFKWKTPTGTGVLYVRIFWPGDPSQQLDLAFSPIQPLTRH
jgi:hypothetical protein